MLIAVVLAATTTACIGVLAFIGIIVPQVARLLLGYDYQKIIPFRFLLELGFYCSLTPSAG